MVTYSVAELIIGYERNDMYNSSTITDNHALYILPSRIEPLLKAILRSDLNAIKLSELKSYNYAKEQLARYSYMDVFSNLKFVDLFEVLV